MAKQEFINWLIEEKKANRLNLKESSINAYANKINTLSDLLYDNKISSKVSLYNFSTAEELAAIYKKWQTDPYFKEKNKKGHSLESSAFKWLILFKINKQKK